ncbi:hypothetical protein J3R82DRAFT_9893, partial [Butyriboletus roseoflavus]
SASIQCHPLYYFPNGTHIFRVCIHFQSRTYFLKTFHQIENTLYKLHNDILTVHSTLFKDMFTIGEAGPYPPVEGKTDTDPILLESEQQAVFDLFLDHINGRWVFTIYYRVHSPLTELCSSRSVGSDNAYSHEQLWNLLRFADKYHCPMTRLFVIDHIWDARYSYHPTELVQLGSQFKVPKLFICGFKLLLDIPLKQIRKEQCLQMGNDVFIALTYAKSLLEEHTCLVAYEEPVILTHTDDCPDPLACQEDWHNVWWNGMGRFLLDVRNPQPFADAVKRFWELQFGHMGTGCMKLMFQTLDCGAGFRHADVFIADICSGLVDELHLADS